MKNIKVAIGIIFRDSVVLLTRRVVGSFKAGFWEFAGGKIEADETSVQALIRESKEELNINVLEVEFLRTFVHKYSEKTVHLEVFIIKEYQNEPLSNEGQELAWVAINEVKNYNILPTVMPLLNFALLPNIYWITPNENFNTQWFAAIEKRISSGVRMIQLRTKKNVRKEVIIKIYKLCKTHNVILMLNAPNRTDFAKYCDGFHITSAELNATTVKYHSHMSASTHTLAEAKKAEMLGFDFIVISPVKHTKSHLNATPLGFKRVSEIAKTVNIPVYFLGGMCRSDMSHALQCGAQGIAGISLI